MDKVINAMACFMALLLLGGCSARLTGKETEEGPSVSVNVSVESQDEQETGGERGTLAGVISSRLGWEIPEGFDIIKDTNGFTAVMEELQIGITVKRTSLWEITGQTQYGGTVQDEALQSKIIDTLDLFENPVVTETVKVELDGQVGFLSSGTSDPDRVFRVLCMQFDSDIIVLVGVAPTAYEEKLDGIVNDVKASRTIFTELLGG